MQDYFNSSFHHLKPQLLHAVQHFDQLGTVLQDSRNKVKVIKVEGQLFNFKRFKKPNFFNKIVYRFFRKSKARRSYEYAAILKEKGIGTPEPIAFLEEVNGLSFGKSFYISKQLNCDFTYRDLSTDDSIVDKEEILKQYAQFMFKMHEAGVCFLDNSPGNTLITKVGDTHEFALVDLNRMKFYDIPWEDRLKNFERLSPQKWMYDVIGLEYAALSRKRPQETIAQMWKFNQDFQEAFQRKKRLKNKFKFFIKGKKS